MEVLSFKNRTFDTIKEVSIANIYITDSTIDGDLTITTTGDVYIFRCVIHGNVNIACNKLQVTDTIFNYNGSSLNPYTIEAEVASFSSSQFHIDAAVAQAITLKAKFSSFFGCHFDFISSASKFTAISFEGKAINLFGCFASIAARKAYFLSAKGCKEIVLIDGGFYHFEPKCHSKLVRSKHAKVTLESVATNLN
jgi:hypothetical protein